MNQVQTKKCLDLQLYEVHFYMKKNVSRFKCPCACVVIGIETDYGVYSMKSTSTVVSRVRGKGVTLSNGPLSVAYLS